jgi:hypothetical protein
MIGSSRNVIRLSTFVLGVLLAKSQLAQPEIGQYFGIFKVIEAPKDSVEQARFMQTYFSVFQNQDYWRSDVNNIGTGLVITIGNFKTKEHVAYFDFHGNKLKMRLKNQADDAFGGLQNQKDWHKGSFAFIDRDTIIAGVNCKLAHWISSEKEVKNREIWYAPEIKVQNVDHYGELPGMPLLIDFDVDVYRVRYEITGISIEPPQPELFIELDDYIEIEQLEQQGNK